MPPVIPSISLRDLSPRNGCVLFSRRARTTSGHRLTSVSRLLPILFLPFPLFLPYEERKIIKASFQPTNLIIFSSSFFFLSFTTVNAKERKRERLESSETKLKNFAFPFSGMELWDAFIRGNDRLEWQMADLYFLLFSRVFNRIDRPILEVKSFSVEELLGGEEIASSRLVCAQCVRYGGGS